MTFEQRRFWAGSILLAAVILGVGWMLRVDYAQKISTDVLDLIPAGQRAPELALVRSLVSEQEARTMLMVLRDHGGGFAPVEAAQRFVAELKGRPFQQAIALADPSWRDTIGKELFAQRFVLLFPSWLERRLTAVKGETDLPAEAARELQRFMATPEGIAYQDFVPADPLLLLPETLRQLRRGLDLLQGGDAGAGTGLIWAQLAVSPLREEGQGPAFAAIESALERTRRQFPNLSVSYTGVNRFAATSRDRIEREVSLLNMFSLAAVLGVAAIFIRAVHRGLHLVPVIACSTLGAWVVTTAVFDRVHIIVFALGALLAGVAIDYGFYLYMQRPARPDETYPEKVRRLAKPLLASCATTVAGFALLLFSELPMIRQLGVFVGAGLISALVAAVLYFALWRNTFLEARQLGRRNAFGGGTKPRLRWLIAAAWVLALAGLTRVQWRDDIRELEIPAPELQEADARIREAFGQRRDRAVYLTHGATIDEARTALAKFERWTGDAAVLANLGAVVPIRAVSERAAEFMRRRTQFPEELRAALDAEGFSADEFEPFFAAYREFRDAVVAHDIDGAVRRLQAQLTGPLGLLLRIGAERSWFVTIASKPLGEPPDETQTVAASQLQSLNRLFSGYRRSALHLSLAGLGLVGIGVLLTYGVRDGLRIFAIPCGTCLGIFGVFGWTGQPLNMFHLLGAFLGVCLTHNYSIFSATSAYRHEPPPVSVRLSALTTGASFGVLALSEIPVVSALGVTVSLMVVAALLVIELEYLSPLQRPHGK